MDPKKRRYTPMEVARVLGVSTAKFSSMVSDELLPKGRVGEDGRRYYTDQDIEFIRRAWKSKITGRFIMVTLPLYFFAFVILAAGIFHFYRQSHREEQQPTIPRGYALAPTQIPTADPILTTPTPEPTKSERRIRYYDSQQPQYNQNDDLDAEESDGSVE